jgi:hypothetical protein
MTRILAAALAVTMLAGAANAQPWRHHHHHWWHHHHHRCWWRHHHRWCR